jgi:Acyl-coenzyme A:6-aminopenicillanic acid acyl-transferase
MSVSLHEHRLTGTGRPPVTAFWYPGFVPANAFALTGDGLAWTVDHLPVAAPGPGAGRHFVGRGLQVTARTVEDAVGYLRSRPSAGGFSYTIGDRAGRVVSVEAAAGRHAVTEAGPGRGPESVLVPGRPHPPAAGWRPLRPRAGRPRADHAVHARRRPDRGGGRDRTARRAACRDPAGRLGRRQSSRAAPLRACDVLAG